MKAPTPEDLARLAIEARKEHGKAEEAAARRDVGAGSTLTAWLLEVGTLLEQLWAMVGRPLDWAAIRSLWLHLALFALRGAWEAERRAPGPRAIEPMPIPCVTYDKPAATGETIAEALGRALLYAADGLRLLPVDREAKTLTMLAWNEMGQALERMGWSAQSVANGLIVAEGDHVVTYDLDRASFKVAKRAGYPRS